MYSMLQYKIEIKLVVLDLYEGGAFMCRVPCQHFFFKCSRC